MYGSHYALFAFPVWVTALVLYTVTMGAIFVLRDRYEGFFYNTSYSAMLGDGALMIIVLMAAGILQRGEGIPWWCAEGRYHVVSLASGAFVGFIWWFTERPGQWGDIYHHLVIAPLLTYLGMTLVPVIAGGGTWTEKVSAVGLVLLWAVLVVFDAKQRRLNQRRWLQEECRVIVRSRGGK